MAYAHTVLAPHDLVQARVAAPKKPSLFRRVLNAMVEARTRQAEREIARYIGGPNAKFTDRVEREIELRLMSNPSRW